MTSKSEASTNSEGHLYCKRENFQAGTAPTHRAKCGPGHLT